MDEPQTAHPRDGELLGDYRDRFDVPGGGTAAARRTRWRGDSWRTDEALPPHVEAAMATPCPEPASSTWGWVALGVLVAANVAWAFWPVPDLTADERAALNAAGVVCVPPGTVVCPVSTVPLQWANPTLQSAVTWSRWLLLTKAGWCFYAPVTAPAPAPAAAT